MEKPEIELAEVPEAREPEMCEVHIEARLRIPKEGKESFLAHLREWGTVSEKAAPVEDGRPALDAYGNPYNAGSGERPKCDAYGNPYDPNDRPPPRTIDQTTDAYGNKLVPDPAPLAEANRDGRGRPLRDAYGNEYRGKY